jgi:uncharacterized protein (DUF58 family)
MLPTPRLAMLAAVSAPLWLVAAAFPPAFPLVAACVAALAAAALVSLLRTPGRRSLSIQREMPSRFSLGGTQEVSLALTNNSSRRIRVELRDDIPDSLEALSQVPPMLLEPFANATARYSVRSRQRGALRFRHVSCRVSQGLALTQRQYNLKVESSGKVYPRFLGIDEYTLLAMRDLREESARPLRSPRGQGSELESLRRYAVGDDFRRIDWKISAKRGTLIARNLLVERGQQLTILLDAGRFMCEQLGGRPRFEHAVDAAVMLASVAQKRGDYVSLACFSNRIESYLPSLRGQRVLPAVLEALADVQPRNVESDYWHVFARVLSRLRKRSLVVLMGDVLDRAGSSGMVNNLMRSARKHLVLTVVLVDEAIQAAVDLEATDVHVSYQKAAASHVLLERAMALDDMRARGILVLETSPQRLSIQLIRKYLEIRKSNVL